MQITVEKISVLWYTILLHKQKTGRKEGDTVPEKSFDVARNIRTVSYTHLTLPTIA